MATAQELIKSSMRLLGLIEVGETPPNDELQDALSALNSMLDGFSVSRHLIYARTDEGFTLTSGTGSYSMGTNTTRAVKIEHAFVRDSSNVDTTLEIINKDRYNNITDKTVQGRPCYLMYDPQYSLSEIHLYPVPDDSYTLYTDSWKVLTSVSALTTTIAFPPGYERMLKYNLALEIAAEFGVTVPPTIFKTAEESIKSLAAINMPRINSDLGIPAGNSGEFNIQSREYYR